MLKSPLFASFRGQVDFVLMLSILLKQYVVRDAVTRRVELNTARQKGTKSSYCRYLSSSSKSLDSPS